MTDDNKEVNIEEQINVETTKDDELIDELKEKETPSESSTEEKPTESSPEVKEEKKEEEVRGRGEIFVKKEEKKLETVTEPRPVEGETPRERALRKEVERLRGRVRETRKQELFTEDKETTETKEIKSIQPTSGTLDKYDKEEVDRLKELLVALAPELGFARKDDLQVASYQQITDGILDKFLSDHPEYLPENDTDDVYWKQFKTEVSLYQKPSNPKDWTKILNRAHQVVFGVTSTPKSKIDAQREKLSTVSHSGSITTKVEKPSRVQLDSSMVKHLKGFSEEDLKELGF